ncbi:methyltransferase [Spongiactinospora rosea]|uniref:Methyltransferase n=1 Tax=Spongiactinospora rosea TaxID=2248750 RepID=A0A366LV80_9ACTN|nr:thiopeptide-type bacteriocin biosynthesis protein [Spongiactinospora rosea]RBQ17224.1 methyltransferase [Spongiactinospora rosea]
MNSHYQQIDIAFPAWDDAETVALRHLLPLLTPPHGPITRWWFIRKRPCWRIRYLNRDTGAAAAHEPLHGRLAALADAGHILSATTVIYEPEVGAFGGAEAMDCAHRLFHDDTRHLLGHLALTRHRPAAAHRYELAILLCVALMRAAGLDWYEEGDVWARVAAHRTPAPPRLDQLGKLRRLMSTDLTVACRPGAGVADHAEWARSFTSGGRRLAELARTGRLERGLRAVLAHHVIFTWNRHGLPHAVQAALASSAATVVFDDHPAHDAPPHRRNDADQARTTPSHTLPAHAPAPPGAATAASVPARLVIDRM